MDKLDITQTDLYLREIKKVLYGSLGKRTIFVNGRHSDAFVYILSGNCSYEFDDGKRFTVRPGDILYLAGGAIYTMYVQTEAYSHIFCDFVFDTDAVRGSTVYTPSNTLEVQNLFRRLLHCYRQQNSKTFVDSAVLLYKIYGAVRETAQDRSRTGDKGAIIETVKGFVDKNYRDENLSVQMLSNLAGMSEVYFRKLFKSNYGMSPAAYLTSVRLREACQLMRYPFLTIEECAIQCGFSSPQYFCRAFRKNLGMTPSDYRKQIGKE